MELISVLEGDLNQKIVPLWPQQSEFDSAWWNVFCTCGKKTCNLNFLNNSKLKTKPGPRSVADSSDGRAGDCGSKGPRFKPR